MSCSTYNGSIAKFYKNIKAERYEKANKALDSNKLLQKPRNRLLYLLEKGKILFLLGKYEDSNKYLNQADDLIEIQRKTIGELAVSTLVNPMTEKYYAQDFEKFMVHYYKALNYLFLNNIEDAVVEARRISLQTTALEDAKSNKENKYSKDAFSLIIQGLIYESNNDLNNAFISYRNALETYLINKDHYWYGVKMPKQLVKDVLRTALANGFYSDYKYLITKLEYMPTDIDNAKTHSGGDLIIFFENGLGPIKEQQELFFTLIRGIGGNFYFQDPSGSINLPVIIPSDISNNTINLSDIGTFRLAFPKWVSQPKPIKETSIELDNKIYNFEKVEDLNTLAIETFNEQFIKEATKALSRLLVKKLAEYGLKSMGNDNNKDLFLAASAAVQLYSLFSEKADTRNWQTLPAEISYARIPLKLGENNITIKLKNQQNQIETKQLTINSRNNRLKFYSFSIFH